MSYFSGTSFEFVSSARRGRSGDHVLILLEFLPFDKRPFKLPQPLTGGHWRAV